MPFTLASFCGYSYLSARPGLGHWPRWRGSQQVNSSDRGRRVSRDGREERWVNWKEERKDRGEKGRERERRGRGRSRE